MTRKILIILTCLLATPVTLFAAEEEIPLYRGIRSQSMGGVITTTGDYAEALFGNPARHSEIEHSKFSLIDLTLSANSNLVTGVKSAKSFSGGSGASTITGATSLIGKNEYARLDLLIGGYYNPHFLGDIGFAFGMLVSTQAQLLLHYTTDINAQTITNVGPNMGVSHRFFEDKLSLGLNLHTLYRIAADDRLSALDFLSGKSLKLKDIANQGVGIDLDFGGYYFVPWKLNEVKMGVGASLNNILKSHYRTFNPAYVNGLGANPPGSSRLLNTGVRFDFNDIWILREPVLAFEINNIGATAKRYSFFKKVHFGGETKITSRFIFRGGVNQGYLGGGIGFNLPLLKIDLATYGQELSGTTGGLEDRRYMFRLALEI